MFCIIFEPLARTEKNDARKDVSTCSAMSEHEILEYALSCDRLPSEAMLESYSRADSIQKVHFLCCCSWNTTNTIY